MFLGKTGAIVYTLFQFQLVTPENISITCYSSIQQVLALTNKRRNPGWTKLVELKGGTLVWMAIIGEPGSPNFENVLHQQFSSIFYIETKVFGEHEKMSAQSLLLRPICKNNVLKEL